VDFNNIPVIIRGPDKKNFVGNLQGNIDTHYGSIAPEKITKLPTAIKISIGLGVLLHEPSYRSSFLI